LVSAEQKPVRRLWEVTRHAFAIFFEIEGSGRAAAFAYYALFSLVPLFALLLTVGSVFVQPSDVIATVEKFFPMDATQQAMVWNMADSLRRARGGIGVAAVAILIWGSMRFFQTLLEGVNHAWHRQSMPWWKLPLKNLAMMAVLSSALGVGLVVPAVLQAAMKLVKAFEGFLEQLMPGMHFGALSLAFSGSRYLVAGGLMFYALAALYMLAPGRRILFRQVWGSALCVAVALQFGQTIFGAYATKFVNYNAIYGPVGAIMLALLWVYIAGSVILLGACYCAAASGVRADAPLKPLTKES
jgi:YihY family inner membrane protein